MGWSARIFEEIRVSSSAAFLTMTYAEEKLVYEVATRERAFEKTHVQNFFKRIRRSEERRQVYGGLKYYATAETGGRFDRPHYHAIVTNLHLDTLGRLVDLWGHGFVHVGKAEPASVNYVTGYCINDWHGKKGSVTRPFSLMSKGIGKRYLTPEVIAWHQEGLRGWYENNGVKSPMPRYFKEKVFTPAQREIVAEKARNEATEAFEKELERLSRLHPSPYALYGRMVDNKYNSIRTNKKTLV